LGYNLRRYHIRSSSGSANAGNRQLISDQFPVYKLKRIGEENTFDLAFRALKQSLMPRIKYTLVRNKSFTALFDDCC
jgi:hypothetical protein